MRFLGPIVRVTPEELSINDPEAYSEVYVAESKRRTIITISSAKASISMVDHH